MEELYVSQKKKKGKHSLKKKTFSLPVEMTLI